MFEEIEVNVFWRKGLNYPPLVVGHYFVIAMYEKLLALDFNENKFIFIIPINTHLIIPLILKQMIGV